MDHAQHDFVGDEFARIHGRLGALAEFCAVTYGRAQQVARGDLRNAVFRLEALGLGALAGARRAEKYDTHFDACVVWKWSGPGDFPGTRGETLTAASPAVNGGAPGHR